MIGNSPRSDINPALAAGLNACFIPHDNTWVLEHEELAQPPSRHSACCGSSASAICASTSSEFSSISA